MSVARVLAQPDGYPGTPTQDHDCLYCGEPLVTGELAVHWAGGGQHVYWHAECAKNWAAPFMRDVWEVKEITKPRRPARRERSQQLDLLAREITGMAPDGPEDDGTL